MTSQFTGGAVLELFELFFVVLDCKAPLYNAAGWGERAVRVKFLFFLVGSPDRRAGGRLTDLVTNLTLLTT